MAEISTIARPYAVAAFNLAKEKKSLTEWSEMLEFLAQVSLDERMHAFINDSKVSDEDREKALLKIAGKKLNQYGDKFLSAKDLSYYNNGLKGHSYMKNGKNIKFHKFILS